MFEGVSCEFELIRLLTNEARGGTSLERSLHIHVHKNHIKGNTHWQNIIMLIHNTLCIFQELPTAML